MEIKKEFKVGVLVLSALVILYFGIDFLKGSDVFNPARSYFVHYENVDGLTASNPVMLNGFQVGLVKKIRIFQGRKKPVQVELEINKDIFIAEDASAQLANNGLLGGKMIVLETGATQKPIKTDTLNPSVAPGFTTMLEDKAQPMVNQVSHLVKTLDEVMDGLKLTLPILNKTLESISELSQTSNGVMADSRKDIQAITGNINKLSLALIDTEKQLKGILGKVDVLGDSLKKADLAGAIHSLHRTTDELNQTVLALNKGQGTMGKLLKSDSLYRNLNASSASLNALLVDFKANPKRYVNFSVFGRKEKKAKETK